MRSQNNSTIQKTILLPKGIELKHYECDSVYTICKFPKSRRVYRPKLSLKSETSTIVLELLHWDTQIPIENDCFNGSHYFIALPGDSSGLSRICLLRRNDDAREVQKDMIQQTETMKSRKIKRLRSDNASELLQAEFSNRYTKRVSSMRSH